MQLTPVPTAPAGATPRALAEPALDGVARRHAARPRRRRRARSRGTIQSAAHARSHGRNPRRSCSASARRARAGQARRRTGDERARRSHPALCALDREPRPDAALEIRYRSAPAGKVSVFAASALVHSLRTLVHGARPLRATDATPQGEAAPEHNDSVFAERSRVAVPLAELEALSSDMKTSVSSLQPLLANPAANRATLIARRGRLPRRSGRAARAGRELRIAASRLGVRLRMARLGTRRVARGASPRSSPTGKQAPEQVRHAAGGLRRACRRQPETRRASRHCRKPKRSSRSSSRPLPGEPSTMRAALNAKRAALAGRAGGLRGGDRQRVRLLPRSARRGAGRCRRSPRSTPRHWS